MHSIQVSTSMHALPRTTTKSYMGCLIFNPILANASYCRFAIILQHNLSTLKSDPLTLIPHWGSQEATLTWSDRFWSFWSSDTYCHSTIRNHQVLLLCSTFDESGHRILLPYLKSCVCVVTLINIRRTQNQFQKRMESVRISEQTP